MTHIVLLDGSTLNAWARPQIAEACASGRDAFPIGTGGSLMSDIDPEVVRLIRELLILTDRLGVGHQTRAQNFAHQLDLAGKVIIDKGSVPDWMEQAPDALTSERKYRFKDES